MLRERGFIPGIGLYAVLAAGAVILGMGLWIKLQGNALERCRTEYAAFVAQAKALGEAAQKEADQEKARLERAKEKADETAKRLMVELNATRQRLRNERTNRNLVPPAPPASRRPQLACFDRTELGAALQRFREGVVRLVGEGDENTVALNSAKGWIRDVFSRAPQSEGDAKHKP